ncbi:hypothetical protein R6Q59_011227 [Mikania micrantha]
MGTSNLDYLSGYFGISEEDASIHTSSKYQHLYVCFLTNCLCVICLYTSTVSRNLLRKRCMKYEYQDWPMKPGKDALAIVTRYSTEFHALMYSTRDMTFQQLQRQLEVLCNTTPERCSTFICLFLNQLFMCYMFVYFISIQKLDEKELQEI